MVEALHATAMGQILDTVSNHMSATPDENLWWNDVLENGPASPHAAYLRHRLASGQGGAAKPSPAADPRRSIRPGSRIGRTEAGIPRGAFFLRFYQSLLPIEPRTYRTILTHGLDALKETMPPDSEDLRELESIVTALEHLPERTDTEPGSVAERQREKEVIKGRLRR